MAEASSKKPPTEKEKAIQKKKCQTPTFLASFPNVFTAEAYGDAKPKFGVRAIFDKTADLSKLKIALKNAAVEKFGDKADAVIAKAKPNPQRWPFHDGDVEKEDDAIYKGKIYINLGAKEDKKPGVVNANCERILDASEIYGGCFMRANVIAYAYDNEFGRGFGFTLRSVQKVKDGPRLGGESNPENEFDAIESEEIDALSDDDVGF